MNWNYKMNNFVVNTKKVVYTPKSGVSPTFSSGTHSLGEIRINLTGKSYEVYKLFTIFADLHL